MKLMVLSALILVVAANEELDWMKQLRRYIIIIFHRAFSGVQFSSQMSVFSIVPSSNPTSLWFYFVDIAVIGQRKMFLTNDV
jgi:hypothetical protein